MKKGHCSLVPAHPDCYTLCTGVLHEAAQPGGARVYARNRVLQASTGGWSGPPAEDEGAEGGGPALDAGLQVGVS